MKKNISEYRKYLINRVGYARNKANLSGRTLSNMLGYSEAYIAKFENGDFSIPAEVILDIIEICGMTVEEFFFEDIANYEENKSLLNNFNKLTNESKLTILNLMKQLR